MDVVIGGGTVAAGVGGGAVVVSGTVRARVLRFAGTMDIGGVGIGIGRYPPYRSSASELGEFALDGGSPRVDARSMGEDGE